MKKNILDILKSKGIKKIVATTAYTYPIAKFASDLEFDIILVGDSLGMVIQGEKSTISVTLEDILYHSKIVSKANENSFVVADMPFLTTDVSIEQTIKNVGLLIQKALVDAVKIEGGIEKTSLIKKIVDIGIPVMGHIGLNPQKILKLGRYSVQGKSFNEEKRLIDEAKALEKAGVFSIVLECVPKELAKTITESVNIPTIGIGAGIFCDGQILVSDDIFGLTQDIKPKFVKKYGDVGLIVQKALKDYKQEVLENIFPEDSHSY